MTQFSSLFGARLDRELRSDDSTVLFTTARRKAAVNEGHVEFADLTECFQRTSTYVIATNGALHEFDLNSTAVIPDGDFVRFSKEQVQFIYTDASSNVTVLAGDDLPRRDVEWLNRYVPGWQDSSVASSVQSLPQMYYERTDGGACYLGLWPPPSTATGETAKLLIPYLALPSPMTSDTNEPFTVGTAKRNDLRTYHQALVHFAAYQLEKLRGDDQASEKQLQKFMGYVERFKAQARKKGGQAVTFVRNYFARRTDLGSDPRR